MTSNGVVNMIGDAMIGEVDVVKGDKQWCGQYDR